MTTKIGDRIAAEEALEAAEREFRRYNDNPSEWSVYESMKPRASARSTSFRGTPSAATP
jgi:hypothetical protein